MTSTSSFDRLVANERASHVRNDCVEQLTRTFTCGVKRARPLEDDGDFERQLLQSSGCHSPTLDLVQGLNTRGPTQTLAPHPTPSQIKPCKKRRTDTQAVQSAIDAVRLTLAAICSKSRMPASATHSSNGEAPLTIRIPPRARRALPSSHPPAQIAANEVHQHSHDRRSQMGRLTRRISSAATFLHQGGSCTTLAAIPKIRFRLPAYLRALRAMGKLEITIQTR